MAWLEAVLELEGSTRGQGGWWSSDVLLDRNIAEQVATGNTCTSTPVPAYLHLPAPLHSPFLKV